MVLNTEIKQLLDLAFDGLTVGQDAVSKNYVALVSDMIKIASEIPALITDFDDIQQELTDLQGSLQQADLLKYIDTKFKGAISDKKAQQVLSVCLQMVQHILFVVHDAIALKAAISSN